MNKRLHFTPTLGGYRVQMISQRPNRPLRRVWLDRPVREPLVTLEQWRRLDAALSVGREGSVRA